MSFYLWSESGLCSGLKAVKRETPLFYAHCKNLDFGRPCVLGFDAFGLSLPVKFC